MYMSFSEYYVCLENDEDRGRCEEEAVIITYLGIFSRLLIMSPDFILKRLVVWTNPSLQRLESRTGDGRDNFICLTSLLLYHYDGIAYSTAGKDVSMDTIRIPFL